MASGGALAGNPCQVCRLEGGKDTLVSLDGGEPCSDGDACTVGESCTDGACGGGDARECTSDNPLPVLLPT